MKKFLIGVGIFFIAVVLIGFIAIKLLVNEALIKDNLVQQVKQRTQQNFVIEGDLKLTFYPQIGFSIDKIVLFNQQDYSNSKQISINNMSLAVDVMSLLTKTIVVDQVKVDGITLNAEVLLDGRNNMQELAQALAAKDKLATDENLASSNDNQAKGHEEVAQPSSLPSSTTASEYTFIVKGVQLSDAQLSLNNRQDGSYHQLSDISLNVGQFQFEKPVGIDLSMHYRSNGLDAQLDSKLQLTLDQAITELVLTQFDSKLKLSGHTLPRQKMLISLNTDIRYNLTNKKLDLTKFLLSVDELTARGELTADLLSKPAISYDITLNNIVIDDWLPEKSASSAVSTNEKTTKEINATATVSKAAAAKAAPEMEPDLSVLSSFDEKGKLTITQVRYGDYVLDNVTLLSSVSKGILEVSELSADLYEGNINTRMMLDSNVQPANFSLHSTINQVQSEKLVTIATGKKWVTGRLDVSMQIKGKGLTPTRIKSATSGRINTEFSDGAILGVNAAQKIRELIAKVSGDAKAKGSSESLNTDFSSLIANFKLGEGKLTSTKIALHSPAVNIDGSGHANLLRENIDFNFGAYLSDEIGGKNSSTMKTIRGLRFPVDIKGPMTTPKIKFDSSSLAKQFLTTKEEKLKKSARKRIDKLLGDDPKKQKIKDEIFKGLDKLFK